MLKKSTTQKFVLADKGSITNKRPLHIAEDLSYNFGEDVVVYDVRNNSPFVSFYVVASAKNETRLRALVQSAKDAIYDNYHEVDHVEGRNDSNWILIDCKDIVVQLFAKEERERVGFDQLYKDVPHKIVKVSEEPVYRRRKKQVKEF